MSRREKLREIRGAMTAEGADVLLLTSLEDIAWLLNLRGGDVACNPVVLSYLSLTQDSAVLFANPAVFSPAVLEQLEADGVSLRPYESVYSYVGRLTPSQRVMLDTRRINTTLLTSIPSHVSVMDRPNPTALRKAIKNPVEIANMKRPIWPTGSH